MSNISNDGTRSDQVVINASATPIEGLYKVNKTKEVLVEVYGTASTASATFYGVTPSGALLQKNGISDDNFSFVQTGSIGSVLRFVISGLKEFKVKVDSVSGGNVSVLIREVA